MVQSHVPEKPARFRSEVGAISGGRAPILAGRTYVGDLGTLRIRVKSLAATRGQGHNRAWLRNRLLLIVAGWRGARPVGIDVSVQQLTHAREFQIEFGLGFPLLLADAETVPLAEESFDLALSEYGASIWCDPYRWIPEAARLLCPGGELIFLVNSSLLMLCVPDDAETSATDRLLRPHFGMHRFEWPEIDEAVEFHIGHGDMIRLLIRSGFEVEDLIELRAPLGAKSRFPFVTAEWAFRWPSEEIWKVRKRV